MNRFLFILVGFIVGAGMILGIQQVYAKELGKISASATVLPNFSVSMEKDTANIKTNMHVMINGQEISK